MTISIGALVDAAFGPDGYFCGKGFAYRPAQHAYSLAIADWLLAVKPVAAINGDAGIGKSLGYLVPILAYSAMTGRRVVVSTHTIQLQRQLLQNDVPAALEFLTEMQIGQPSVARRLGRRNYVSALRAQRLASEFTHCSSDDQVLLATFLRWADTSASGLIQEWLDEHGELPCGISEHEVCLLNDSDDADSARFLRDANLGREADVVITSHAVTVLNALHKSAILATDGEAPVSAYLFDEADKIASVATEQTRTVISPRMLAGLASGLPSATTHKPAVATAQLASSALDALDERLRSIGDSRRHALMMWDQLPKATQAELNELACRASSAFASLATMAPKIRKISALSPVLGDAATELAGWQDDDGSKLIQWSPVRHYPSLTNERLHAGWLMRALFAPKAGDAARCCFTSATLTLAPWHEQSPLNDPFKGFLSEIGAWHDSVAFTRTFSPEQYGHLTFRLISPSTPPPFFGADMVEMDDGTMAAVLNAEWLSSAAAFVARAAQSGTTLVLTGSHRESHALAARLTASVPVYVHDAELPLSSAAERLKETGGVLLSAGAWEGFSERAADGGQLFTELVISRIPIRPNSESLRAALIAEFVRQGKTPDMAERAIFAASRTLALRKLRQGIGRGTRDAQDRVTVWIADPRFDMPDVVQPRNIPGSKYAIPERFAPAWRDAAVDGVQPVAQLAAIAPRLIF